MVAQNQWSPVQDTIYGQQAAEFEAGRKMLPAEHLSTLFRENTNMVAKKLGV